MMNSGGTATWCIPAGMAMIVFMLSSAATQVNAQAPKAPALGYVFPPAVCAGEATDVQLGGFDFTIDMQWFVYHSGVQLQVMGAPGEYHIPPPPYWTGPRTSTTALPIPREVAGRLTVEADAAEGLVRWQVANANGSSDTAVLFVSRGTEIVESRSRDFPQQLPALPVGICGRLGRLTEVDRYQFVAADKGLVTVELMARRLGSDFNGVLEVHDQYDRLLADFADTLGLDGHVTFPVQQGAAYTISLHDTDFRGDRSYVYRLAVSAAPRILFTVPAAGQRGATQSMQLIGYGLRSGSAVLESIHQEIEFSSDPAMEVQRYAVTTPLGAVDVRIPLSDLSERSRRTAAQSVQFPGAVTGIMSPGMSEHRYQWESGENEDWSIAVESRSLGSRMDVSLEILSPDGRRAAENDDLPGTTDSGLDLHTSAAGTWTAIVRSLSVIPADSSGDLQHPSEEALSEFVYRLRVERSVPDYSLSVPQKVSIALGSSVELPVQLVRTAGFAEEVRLSVDGLPAGVTMPEECIIPAGASSTKIVLQSAPDAAATAAVIRIQGTVQQEGTLLTRTAHATASGNLCPRSAAEQQTADVLLTMTMTAPFEVQVIDRERQRDVHRGTTYPAELKIVRDEGFTGEIQLEMSAHQSRYRAGILGSNITVPPTEETALYPCFMPEWLGTELTRRMVVHGVAVVADPQGNMRHLTRSGDARITMIMEGALMKLNASVAEISIRPGETIEIPVSLSRSPTLPLSATVQLVPPEEINHLLQALPIVLKPDQENGVMVIQTAADAALAGPWTLTLKATAMQDHRWPVVSQTDISVTVENE